uniref:uncharacterized protein LOC113474722 n=1 Tax=Ciona intestinalis TaxID=7719 RepID=UPI000EF43E76|nr:uncharacterized protein LOC113474722 [Ciona intestinalis]|eukprot:XP_026692698.1 uncharacterized protein LOC113474722 [Ciona intestinalis]
MLGSGELDFQLFVSQSGRIKQNLLVLITVSVIVVCEVFIFLLETISTWRSIRKKTNKSRSKLSAWQIWKKISLLKKCFICCNFFLIFDCTLLILQQVVPLIYTDLLCTIAHRVLGPTLITSCTSFVYCFLWVRQYGLQNKPLLKSALPPWLPKLSIVTLTITVLCLLFPIFLAWVPLSSGYPVVVCYYSNSSCYQIPSQVKSPVLLVFPTFIPTVYIFLFYKISSYHKKASASIQASSKSLDSMLQRCLIVSSICIFTSIICNVGIMFSTNHVPIEITQLFARIDSFVNLACLLFCFKTNSLQAIYSTMRQKQFSTKVIRIGNNVSKKGVFTTISETTAA